MGDPNGPSLISHCFGISAATYGTEWPLVGSAGGRRVAQRADKCGAARHGSHKQFTQVRAAVRRKTLLLLWWIDGGRVVVERSTLARQGRQWLRAYEGLSYPTF